MAPNKLQAQQLAWKKNFSETIAEKNFFFSLTKNRRFPPFLKNPFFQFDFHVLLVFHSISQL